MAQFSGSIPEAVMRKSGKLERCALLADPKGENQKQFPVYPVLFPEEVALKVLTQMKGFDPKAQPVAFPDLSPFEEEAKRFRLTHRDVSGLANHKRTSDSRNSAKNGESGASGQYVERAGKLVGLSVLTLVILAGVFLWLRGRN